MTGKKPDSSNINPSSSTPSAPSREKLRDHAERLRQAAEQYNKRIMEANQGLEESDVADLYAAFELISQLSDFIKKEKEKKIKEKEKEREKNKKGKEKENEPSEPKLAIDSWLRSKNLRELKEVLYEAVSAAKDFASSGDAKKMVRGILKNIGGGHVFNIVFIVVANTWERYEDMSKNEEECLSLLEAINRFAKSVIQLQNDPELKKRMEDDVKGAIELIIETCIVCCTQIEASKKSRFLWTTGCGAELAKLEKQLQQMYMHILLQMSIVNFASKGAVQLQKPDYPEYPKDAGKSSSTPSSSRLPKESDYAETIMEAAKELDKENVDGDFIENHTPSIAGSDVPSSSTPSSSVLKEPDRTKQISGSADAVDLGNVNANLNDLSNYISQYLAFIKHGGEKPSPVSAAECDWPGSKSAIDLKELMSGVAETAKDRNAKTIAQASRQGVGELHILATGFLVLGNIMEQFEKIASNKDECLCLLERMNDLIQEVKRLRAEPALKKAMETEIKEAIQLIIEASLACCTQIDRPKYKKFFSTNVNTKELLCFQTRLTELHRKIQLQMNFGLHDLRLRVPPCPRASEEFRRENRAQIKTVTERLKLESEERAVAVILYGLGGTGKTALADAVYWSMYHEKVLPYRNHEEVLECKYSYVRLFHSITSVPNIPELQTQVLQDLGSRLEIRRYEEGRYEIGSILEKEVVFIYIDNVLQGLDAFEKLLPRTTDKVKKLRLLITTPDKGAAVRACNVLGIETELYPIEPLEDTKAMQLVKEELNGWDEKLDSNQINQIVQICGGIPRLLRRVAAYIEFSGNREEAQERYHQVISEIENNWNGHEG